MEKELPKFLRWISSYLGDVAPIVALADVISRGLGSLSIPLGSSYSFWMHVHVTANIYRGAAASVHLPFHSAC